MPELGSDLDTLSRNAYHTLRDRIVALELPPGALLSENSLGVSLGLSRTPIREALKRLEREYLVRILPRRGILVTEIDLKSQLQLLEIRRGVEMRLIERGAQRATAEQKRDLAALAAEMAACAENSDLGAYVRLDTRFDEIVEQAAGNLFLTDAMRPVHALVRRFWHSQCDSAGLHDVLATHARVVRAAADGDGPSTRRFLDELYDINEKYILSLLA